MPRIFAICSVTFTAGSTPPLPGFAPCESLISNAFTCGRDATSLARVHPAAGERRASRQCAHRGLGDRPEAHAADVDYRPSEERLLAKIFADRKRRRRQAVFLQYGIGMVDKQDRAGLVGVVGRAEADHASFGFGQAVYPAASGA